MRFTPESITSLAPGDTFCYESSYSGRHEAGDALKAKLKFGAEEGTALGPTGRCWAIATRNERMELLPIDKIEMQVPRLYKYARKNPTLRFLVTPVGCGPDGYTPAEIGLLFHNHGQVPDNVMLPMSFAEFAERQRNAN